MRYKAYLIVICDNETNAVIGVDIWSSPEWEQSRCLRQRVFIAYAVCGDSFDDARKRLIESISRPASRYYWTLHHMPDELLSQV